MCTPLLLLGLSCDEEPILQTRLLHGSVLPLQFSSLRQKMIVPPQDHLAASRWLLELPAWWVVSRSCVKSSLGFFWAFISFLTSASLPFKMFKEPCNLMSSVSQRLGGIAWVCNLTFEHWGAPWTTNQPIQTPARHKAAAGSAPACGRNLAWRIFF